MTKPKANKEPKLVDDIIREKIVEQWPESVKSLADAWADFPTLEEVRANQVADSHREKW